AAPSSENPCPPESVRARPPLSPPRLGSIRRYFPAVQLRTAARRRKSASCSPGSPPPSHRPVLLRSPLLHADALSPGCPAGDSSAPLQFPDQQTPAASASSPPASPARPAPRTCTYTPRRSRPRPPQSASSAAPANPESGRG